MGGYEEEQEMSPEEKLRGNQYACSRCLGLPPRALHKRMTVVELHDGQVTKWGIFHIQEKLEMLIEIRMQYFSSLTMSG
jgi:hypothetical protein